MLCAHTHTPAGHTLHSLYVVHKKGKKKKIVIDYKSLLLLDCTRKNCIKEDFFFYFFLYVIFRCKFKGEHKKKEGGGIYIRCTYRVCVYIYKIVRRGRMCCSSATGTHDGLPFSLTTVAFISLSHHPPSLTLSHTLFVFAWKHTRERKKREGNKKKKKWEMREEKEQNWKSFSFFSPFFFFYLLFK